MSEQRGRLLVRNVKAWRWTSLPGYVPSPSTPALPFSGSISGELVPDSWVAVNASGMVTARGTAGTDPAPDPSAFDTVLDGHGAVLLPGLVDSHIHVAWVGETSRFLDLKDCHSIAQFKRAVRAHCHKLRREALERAPTGNAEAAAEALAMFRRQFVVGVLWDQTKLSRYPTRHDVDAACGGRDEESLLDWEQEAGAEGPLDFTDVPVFLWRACWHIGVGNSTALRLARILPPLDAAGDELVPLVKSVAGGVIEMSDGDGDGGPPAPTGVLKERAVELMVALIKGGKAPQDQLRDIADGLGSCLRAGLTAVQTNDENALGAYRQLEERGALPLRTFLTPMIADLAASDAADAAAASSKSGSAGPVNYLAPATAPCYRCLQDSAASPPPSCLDNLLTVDRVKIFSDGSLGAETAAIRKTDSSSNPPGASTADPTAAPISDAAPASATTHSGVLMYSDGELDSMIALARRRDYRLEIHAIGDAAAAQVLAAMERGGVTRTERAILTHCQVLGADLIAQMDRLGVVANVQPSFVPTDMTWIQQRFSGPAFDQQMQYAYIWRSLLHRSNEEGCGIRIAGGSDAPVESCSPFQGMFDAVFREGRGGDGAVFKAEECLSFAEALFLYTIGGAFAACKGGERVFGQIEAGFAADFVLAHTPGAEGDIASNPRLLQSLVASSSNGSGDGPAAADLAVVVAGRVRHVHAPSGLAYLPGARTDSKGTGEARPVATTTGGPYAPGRGGYMPLLCPQSSRAVPGSGVAAAAAASLSDAASADAPGGDPAAVLLCGDASASAPVMSLPACRCCALRMWLKQCN